MAAKLESHIDRRVQAESFSYWMVRHRGRLLERVRDRRFLQEAFEIWRERYEGIHGALDLAFQAIQRNRSVKILKSSMHIWRETLRFRRDEGDLAAVLSLTDSHLICRYVMKDYFYGNLGNLGNLVSKPTKF